MLGYEQCNAAPVGPKKWTPNAVLYDCYLAAEKRYAVAIKLKDMGLYETYAARIRIIAKDADAKKITVAETNARFQASLADYFSAINQAYAKSEADNADMTNFLWGSAGAFMTGAAQGQATTSKPVICSSTTNGGIVNTVCN